MTQSITSCSESDLSLSPRVSRLGRGPRRLLASFHPLAMNQTTFRRPSFRIRLCIVRKCVENVVLSLFCLKHSFVHFAAIFGFFLIFSPFSPVALVPLRLVAARHRLSLTLGFIRFVRRSAAAVLFAFFAKYNFYSRSC